MAAPSFSLYAFSRRPTSLPLMTISQTHNIPIVADITAFVVSLSIDGRVLDHGGVADVLLHADSKLIAQVEQANEEDEKEGAIIDAPRPDEQVVKPKASGKLIMAEEIATGRVSWAACQFNSLTRSIRTIDSAQWLCISRVLVDLCFGSSISAALQHQSELHTGLPY